MNNTLFLKSGSTYRVSNQASMDLHDVLPPGNYIIKIDPFENLYLESVAAFDLPPKLYGKVLQHTSRIINSFKDRPGSTGVLLTGEKGSGKTLLAKNVAMQLATEGVPTILINSPFRGDKFNKILQDITQPCVVFFDEFEKVYDEEEQEEILTLLDGVYTSKKLYVLTCNDKWQIDRHMRNRPGRIYYLLDFKGVDEEFIRMYCEENLKNLSHLTSLCTMAGMFSEFNFDMLKAVVEEMNRYNESPAEVLKMLNAKPEFEQGSKYDITLFDQGIPVTDFRPKMWSGNPLSETIVIQYEPMTGVIPPQSGNRKQLAKEMAAFSRTRSRARSLSRVNAPSDYDAAMDAAVGYDAEEDDDDSKSTRVVVSAKNLVTATMRNGQFSFQDNGITVTLTRSKEFTYSYLDV